MEHNDTIERIIRYIDYGEPEDFDELVDVLPIALDQEEGNRMIRLISKRDYQSIDENTCKRIADSYAYCCRKILHSLGEISYQNVETLRRFIFGNLPTMSGKLGFISSICTIINLFEEDDSKDTYSKVLEMNLDPKARKYILEVIASE